MVAVVVLVLGVVAVVVLVLGVVAVVVLLVNLHDPVYPLARVNNQQVGIDRVQILYPRLKTYAVDDDRVGRLYPLDIAERRLPVVRLYAARNKDGHVGHVAGDRLGNLVHRIERCDDGYSADIVAAAAAGRDNAVRPRFADDGRVVGRRGGFRAAFNRSC